MTIAQLLGHSVGLSAETPAPWWERTAGSLRPELADVLGDQSRTHPVGRRHQYSNPRLYGSGFTDRGGTEGLLEDVLRSEILEPLGLRRTSGQPEPPHAGGWAVHPWADVMLPEPSEDLGLMAPAGQLWSTAADLCRFAAFLAEGDERVLSAASVQEMRTPSVPTEAGEWDSSYGLGIQIVRKDGRTLVGHTGSLPGFLAGLWVSVDDGIAAVALANATSGPLTAAVAADLVRIVAEAEPLIPQPWRPLPEVDHALLELTGAWYWVDSILRAASGRRPRRGTAAARRHRPRVAFRRGGGWDLDRTRRLYPGETLRHLDLGSFVFSREPYEPGAAVPSRRRAAGPAGCRSPRRAAGSHGWRRPAPSRISFQGRP